MRKTSIILFALALLMTLTLPFILPSGGLLDEARNRMQEELWAQEEQEESSWLRFLLPAATAEEKPLTPLPIDFSKGPKPDPNGFSETGYVDDSIELRLETISRDGVEYRVAYVTIVHPSQLRTATAGKPGSNRVALISSMAEKYNAVLAINANYMSNDPVKTSFEYRMGEKIRNKINRTKDLLIIDEKGDFHVFVLPKQKDLDAFFKAGHQIINAFTFGPTLVKDGVMQTTSKKYGYNPNGREPRMAIAQMGELSYMMVLAEGRKGFKGATHQELAQFMSDMGAVQAYNLDGGNSATMVFNGGYCEERTKSSERSQSDMIYFASLLGDRN
ncbi:MAG: phosphodiester glycosidase family protein [Clostridiales bacterium]|nr:phosphodiester glycosidase family protein [Clostridiales bacterium]